MLLALKSIKVCAILENICRDQGEEEPEDNIGGDPMENVPNFRNGRPRVNGNKIARGKAVRDQLFNDFCPQKKTIADNEFCYVKLLCSVIHSTVSEYKNEI